MKYPRSTALPIVGLTVVLVAHAETIGFDHMAARSLPAGWNSTKTGKGTPRWRVEKDDTAPSPPHVLKESGKATYGVSLAPMRFVCSAAASNR